MGTQFPGADPGGTWEGRRGNAKCSLNNPKQLSAQPTIITYLSFHTGACEYFIYQSEGQG